MKVLILAGGMGTRISEQAQGLPKPMIEVGGKPIIWHVMKTYAHDGFNEFIILLGHKSEMMVKFFNTLDEPEWKITLLDTGIGTSKAQRIKLAQELIQEDYFFTAYGDDVSDISPSKILETHVNNGKIVTLLAIPLYSDYGVLELNELGEVKSFQEKPKIKDQWINGGYFCFSKEIFSYLNNPNEELEEEIFSHLAKIGMIGAFKYEGFWKCMNTYKDKIELDKLIKYGKASWIKWK